MNKAKTISIISYTQEGENDAYKYVLKSYPRGKDYGDIKFSCQVPQKVATIDRYSNCILCECDGWLPVPVGKITDFTKLEEIWTNNSAQTIQQDVKDKKFTNCAVTHCGVINRNKHVIQHQLIIGIDDSCNLQCPSCRKELIMHESGPLYDMKLNAVNHTIDLLNNFTQPIHIILACNGDPLASHIYRPLLKKYIGLPTQTFTLFTNGLLIKKQLKNTALENRITKYKISVDAGSADVYEKVRLGGKWNILLENLEYLSGKNKLVTLVFTIQNNNYRDVLNFEKLCKKYNFNGSITQLDDWATWPSDHNQRFDSWSDMHGTFNEHNVTDPAHKNYEDCRNFVKQLKYSKLTVMPLVKERLKI